jgi:outer membrane lipoprotein-sorting protein
VTFLSRFRALVVLVTILPLSGCLFRSHKVERQYSTAPLKTATQAQLLEYINTQASKIHSLQATVDIDTSVGGSKKGKVTDYQQIRGYVLIRKPAMLRMIGLMPIVRNRAFDMVSDGHVFKLWIPPKNRFIIGRNDIETHNPKQALESLRPQVIYDALLLREVDPQFEIAVMESGYETVTDAKRRKLQQSDYEIEIIRKGGKGWFLSRKIIFSRTDLLPHRQFIYDENGNVATDTRYEAYKDYGGINFPTQIQIDRPQEEYNITLTLVKVQVNEPLTDDKFVLEQPPGAEVVHLDQPQAPPTKGGDSR